MGLTTSQSNPHGEVILHKGYVLSNPYMTQGTYRITLASNLCGTYIKQLRNHDITNVQGKSCKSGPLYGKGNKAWNLERTTSHIGKGTRKIPIYEWIPRNISDMKVSLQPNSRGLVFNSSVRRASWHHQLYNGFLHSLSQTHMLI